MTEKLAQQDEIIKIEYKSEPQTLTELETREDNLKHPLPPLNFTRQLHGRGITRSLPTGFLAGGNGR